ncbi:MAG TPA: hypothetical protein VGW38_04980 [Chloroflexota bacterium]|nr:hypothetical protein [Chloroflexota bacterium]
MEDLDHPAGGGDVELEVQRPDLVRGGGGQSVGGRGRGADPGPLAALWRYSQPLFPPQALDLLAVEAVALPHQHRMGPAVAPAGMSRAKRRSLARSSRSGSTG